MSIDAGKNVKKWLTSLIKSNRSVKIEGGVNIEEIDVKARAKEDKRQDKKESRFLEKIQSSFTHLTGGLKEAGKTAGDAAGKTKETAFDIFTTSGPFGQTVGLLNESLKGLGFDIPELEGKIGERRRESKETKSDKRQEKKISQLELERQQVESIKNQIEQKRDEIEALEDESEKELLLLELAKKEVQLQKRERRLIKEEKKLGLDRNKPEPLNLKKEKVQDEITGIVVKEDNSNLPLPSGEPDKKEYKKPQEESQQEVIHDIASPASTFELPPTLALQLEPPAKVPEKVSSPQPAIVVPEPQPALPQEMGFNPLVHEDLKRLLQAITNSHQKELPTSKQSDHNPPVVIEPSFQFENPQQPSDTIVVEKQIEKSKKAIAAPENTAPQLNPVESLWNNKPYEVNQEPPEGVVCQAAPMMSPMEDDRMIIITDNLLQAADRMTQLSGEGWQTIDDRLKEEIELEREQLTLDREYHNELMANSERQHEREVKERQREARLGKVADKKERSTELKWRIKESQEESKRWNRLAGILRKPAKKEKVKVKKEGQKPDMKAAAKVAGGLFGGGLFLQDMMQSGKLDLKSGLFGQAPEKYTTSESGERVENEDFSKQAGLFVMKQAAKLGSLGYAVGGEKGALLGMLVGGVSGGMQVFWQSHLKPFIDEKIVPIFEVVSEFGEKVRDTIDAVVESTERTFDFIDQLFSGEVKLDLFKGVKEGLSKNVENVTGGFKESFNNMTALFTGRADREDEANRQLQAETGHLLDRAASIVGDEGTFLKETLLTVNRARPEQGRKDELHILDEYGRILSDLEKAEKKYGKDQEERREKVAALFTASMESALASIVVELKKNGKLQEKLSHETIEKLSSMKAGEKGEILHSAGLISSSPNELIRQLVFD